MAARKRSKDCTHAPVQRETRSALKLL